MAKKNKIKDNRTVDPKYLVFENVQRVIHATRTAWYGNAGFTRSLTEDGHIFAMKQDWYRRLAGAVYETLFRYGPLTQKECVGIMWTDDSPPEIRSVAAERSIGTLFAPLRRAGNIEHTTRRLCSITGMKVWEWDVTRQMPKAPVPIEKLDDDKVQDLQDTIEDLQADLNECRQKLISLAIERDALHREVTIYRLKEKNFQGHKKRLLDRMAGHPELPGISDKSRD